jgi:phage terminase small subunit
VTGPLRNTRHERFCQALLEGKSATAAYEAAGYAKDDGNAARLRVNPRIQERLVELQNEVAGATKITVASLLDELEEARKRADSLDQLSAVVKAISEKARISGLMVQKLEIGPAGAFDKCETVEQIADEMLLYEPLYRPVTDQERQGLIDLLNEQGNAVQEYLVALKAKPIKADRAYSQRRAELDRPGIKSKLFPVPLVGPKC